VHREHGRARRVYPLWKGNVTKKLKDHKGQSGPQIASALRTATKFASRRGLATQMLREAIDSIEESAGDADGYELLDAAARMADADDLCETRIGPSKRQHTQVELGALEKRKKLNITLDVAFLTRES
jgi:hypothetical protein